MRFPIISSGWKLPNWFSRIKESSSDGKWQEVFAHYREMKKAGVQLTDPSLFHPIVKACSFLPFKHGQSVHACLIKQGLESFPSMGNSIMDFYVKSGAFHSARHVFDSMRSRESVSWNIMIHGQLHRGALEEGLWLFMQGRNDGFESNTATLVLVIHACRSLRATHEGLKMHGFVIIRGFWAIVSVQNSLLSFYSDIEIEIAHKLFDEMCGRDLISWSVMIGGYVQSGEAVVAFMLFRKMVCNNEIVMDGQIMVNVIKACIHMGKVSIARLVHGFVICRGLGYDVFVAGSLVDMYAKCDDIESASKVFREMPMRNNVSWNSLLAGFISNEKYSEALSLFDSMSKEGIEADEVTLVNLLQTCKHFCDPIHCKCIHSVIIRRGYEVNDLVLSSLIDAYAKGNLITFAWNVFHQAKRRDTVTWSTMIAGFTHCGMPDEAIAIFQEMNETQNKPNAITVLNLLEACSVSAELKRSKSAHAVAIRRGLAPDVAVGTAILDMYSKCGAIESSERVFEQLPQSNIISWGAMIAAYGMNGLPHSALALFHELKTHGLKPNPVTTLSVLSACSHGGLIEEGLLFFDELVKDDVGQLRLEHYSCVVDLLARGGKLDIAMELIKKMAVSGPNPGASAWGALLSGCRSHGNRELGSDAVSRVVELEPCSSAGYLLALSMYAAGGRWSDAARMRWLVKERGVRMVTGYSLVHVSSNNKAFKFVAGDNNNKHYPFSGELCLVSEQLHSCMKFDDTHIHI
ncbi:pentatricopeptide repeat-containing protein At2g17210 [Rhododendron vialii]|uniref:pentatricopeptide repeat-containing protein At2g17210 n=1 Tax=Rhododendron vialii TaxID=182163 RepID=UPI00265E7012|nr:pentatricopeptide repeat-containing protein At2g17210 [Rhododendron vialii]